MKRFQCRRLLANTHELDRLAGNRPDRQGSTTTGIAVCLGQDDTRQRQYIIKGTCRIRRILTGHAVNHKQGLHRLCCFMQAANLAHHFIIDVQATGGINNHHVQMLFACMADGITGDFDRILVGAAGKELCLDLARQRFQLLNSRRPVNITTGHQHSFLVALFQHTCQLGSTGGLARAL